MRTLDRELERTAEEIKTAGRRIPERKWATPPRRSMPRFAIAIASAALVLMVIGLPALLAPEGQSPSEDAPPVPIEPPKGEAALQYLLTLRAPGWEIYPNTVHDLRSEGGNVSIGYIESSKGAAGGEALLEMGAHIVLPTFGSGPDNDPPVGSGAVEFLMEETTVRGKPATLYNSPRADGLHLPYALVWTEAPGMEAMFMAGRSTVEELVELAEMLVVISEEEFAEIAGNAADLP